MGHRTSQVKEVGRCEAVKVARRTPWCVSHARAGCELVTRLLDIVKPAGILQARRGLHTSSEFGLAIFETLARVVKGKEQDSRDLVLVVLKVRPLHASARGRVSFAEGEERKGAPPPPRVDRTARAMGGGTLALFSFDL